MLFKFFTVCTILALVMSTSAVPTVDLAPKDQISIIISGNTGLYANGKPLLEECNDQKCNEACYQHSGSFGGNCDEHRQCICKKLPRVIELAVQQLLTKNNDEDIHIEEQCNKYSDCSNCFFYERCCYKEGGAGRKERIL
ncbi:hypothetical protein F5884DRAFT_129531 [Xylogone sp. PMI_703]|nr:hypothetical protein F5884DRAFT_129531 [Xylogone sp. PMI_703]